jgi:plastocyanin
MRALHRALLLTILVVACGGGDTPTDPYGVGGTGGGTGGGGTGGGGGGGGPGLSASVTVSDNVFSPATVHIQKGGTVTWNWLGGDGYSGGSHNVSFANGTGTSDKTSGTYEQTFPTAGTFAYECTNHPSTMKGSVVVH